LRVCVIVLSLLYFFCFCLSGLAAAYKLKSNGVKVTVFEAEGRAGGKLRSVSHHDLVWDEGANTMVTIYLSKFFFQSFVLIFASCFVNHKCA